MVGAMSPTGCVSTAAGAPSRDVADEELVGNRPLQQPVDVPQVAAEQVVELEVVGRRSGRRRTTRTSRCLRRSAPPRAHAPGDAGVGVGRRAGRARRARRRAGSRPCWSSAMADPDVEVRVDPRSRKDAVQLAASAPAQASAMVTVRSSGCACQPAVERAQERPAAALEVLPGIFAVQDDRDAAPRRPAGALADSGGRPRRAGRRSRRRPLPAPSRRR